ncbi:MAG: homocysteine S-methyltransferase family protein [Novosphingobium sp.]|uniref:homocysteine S-methyltransferase family protein n=1 Tax=Novosphingobium sp. TaxID=1874826 RepID=UPI0032BD79CA
MITILDGGMGRELQRSGAPFRQPEWSALALIEAPDTVAEVHRAYARAGAQIITTNSYALVPFHLGQERFTSEGRRLAALAGEMALQAKADFPGTQIAGSLPPVCGSYRPDLVDEAAAAPILAELVAGLSPYADLWLAETLSSLTEARLVARQLAGDPRPLWLSFTLADGLGERAEPGNLRSGESIEAAVAVANDLGAAALLFNCSQPEVMEQALHRASLAASHLNAAFELGVYANAFPPQAEDAAANDGLSPLRSDLDPPGYLGWAQNWVDAGARIIGGCCGIGPEHIAVLAERLRCDN